MKTKIEYVKVENTPREIYQMLLSGDELYVDKKDKLSFDGEQFVRGNDRVTYISANNDIYRKTETVVTWRDEIEESYHVSFRDNKIVTFRPFGLMHEDGFIQMCRIVIANVDGDSNEQ